MNKWGWIVDILNPCTAYEGEKERWIFKAIMRIVPKNRCVCCALVRGVVIGAIIGVIVGGMLWG